MPYSYNTEMNVNINAPICFLPFLEPAVFSDEFDARQNLRDEMVGEMAGEGN